MTYTETYGQQPPPPPASPTVEHQPEAPTVEVTPAAVATGRRADDVMTVTPS
jgi:hypothetical protein